MKEVNPLQPLTILSDVLGLSDTCFMRFSKRTRNPDVFTYDHSIDYKEDFCLIQDSFCDCGCKSAIYVKEEWDGDSQTTEFKSQIEYEKLPDRPNPTKEQTKLQTDIIRANGEEEELGIIHNQSSCSEIPIP